MPGLDAIRGVAILSVLLYHGLYWDLLQTPPVHSLAEKISGLMTFGWLGVFLFFVLSGFLITGILLDSKQKHHYWRNFYVRRLLRILPAFLLTLFVLRVWMHVTWLYVLVCLANMANLAGMLHISGPVYGVFWSLAVEEQFYLGWPWLVKGFSRRHFAYFAIGSVALSPLLRYVSASGILPLGDVHGMTWLISDNLAMGALIALLLRSRWGKIEHVRRIAWTSFIAGLSLLVAGLPFGILHRTNLFGSALQTVPFEFMFAGLLLFSLMVGDRPTIYSWTRPLRFMGYISYSLYLYHILVFGFTDRVLQRFGFGRYWSAWQWVARFAGEATLATLLAYLSRRYFEQFFLFMKAQLSPAAK
jgi:peptidoglycan/LPS O-acetylase OafA/YrhL